MTFDLDIGNEPLAQQIAQEYLNNVSLQAIVEGGRVAGDSAQTIRNPRAMASIVTVALLARGVSTAPGISVSNVKVSNEQR